MVPEDRAIISTLLDDEASPAEVEAALVLLEDKPQLMEFFQRQHWLRAQWQKEYEGPMLDLSGRIWRQIEEDDSLQKENFVDELARRRSTMTSRQVTVEGDQAVPEAVLEQANVVSVLAHQSATQIATTTDETDKTEQHKAVSAAHQRWLQGVWMPLLQFAVAASVCFVVVGGWYLKSAVPYDAIDIEQESQLADSGQTVSAVPSQANETATEGRAPVLQNRSILSGPVAGATVASVGTYSEVAPAALKSSLSEQELAYRPDVGLDQRLRVASAQYNAMSSAVGPSPLVSLESLEVAQRAKLDAFYMMHTSNSALLQPLKGIQLVRIVDVPTPLQTKQTVYQQ